MPSSIPIARDLANLIWNAGSVCVRNPQWELPHLLLQFDLVPTEIQAVELVTEQFVRVLSEEITDRIRRSRELGLIPRIKWLDREGGRFAGFCTPEFGIDESLRGRLGLLADVETWVEGLQRDALVQVTLDLIEAWKFQTWSESLVKTRDRGIDAYAKLALGRVSRTAVTPRPSFLASVPLRVAVQCKGDKIGRGDISQFAQDTSSLLSRPDLFRGKAPDWFLEVQSPIVPLLVTSKDVAMTPTRAEAVTLGVSVMERSQLGQEVVLRLPQHFTESEGTLEFRPGLKD